MLVRHASCIPILGYFIEALDKTSGLHPDRAEVPVSASSERDAADSAHGGRNAHRRIGTAFVQTRHRLSVRWEANGLSLIDMTMKGRSRQRPEQRAGFPAGNRGSPEGHEQGNGSA